MEDMPQCLRILEKTKRQGLVAVISYLQKKFKSSFLIIDNQGEELYNSGLLLEPAMRLAILTGKTPEWYEAVQQTFVWRLGRESACLFLVVRPVAKASLPDVTTVLQDIKLALAFYLHLQVEEKTRFIKIEHDLMEVLLGPKHGENIDEFLPFGHFNLNIDKPYVIQLIHLEQVQDPVTIRGVIDHLDEYAKKNKLPSMRAIYWQDNLVHIIPALYKSETFELRQEWPEVKVSEVFRKSAEQKFGIKICIGIGQIYSLSDLFKSYTEARIALTFRRLLGDCGFVQRFADLGCFRYVFSQDVEISKKFVMDNLGEIIRYDNQKQADFLNTLRILVDNGFNWKETAEKCNVHVNTIYYRMERIEKLIHRKLQDSDTKFDLFVALKLWDVLISLGALDDYFIGTIRETAPFFADEARAGWE